MLPARLPCLFQLFGVLLLLASTRLTAAAQASGSPPIISSFTPTTGPGYTNVVIVGSGFTRATAVQFNGLAASQFTVASDVEIRMQAPYNVVAGPIQVITPAGTASSTGLFIPPVAGLAFAPSRGNAGAVVRLTGRNLVQVSSVTLNNVPAVFTVVSANEVLATVPANATTGRFRVTTPAGTATTWVSFTVPTTLSVIAKAPAANANQVPVGSAVTLQFTQPITAASAQGVRVFGAQAQGRRTGVLSGGGTAALTFAPGRGFLPGEQVSVSAPASLISTAGVALNAQVYQFRNGVGGTGQGTFAPTSTARIGPDSQPRISTGDLDHDGDVDVVVSAIYTTPQVYLNTGAGTYDGPFTVGLPAQVSAVEVALGDVDGDGDLDLVAADNGVSSNSYVPVCLNNGLGTLTYSHFVLVPPGSDHVVLGDLDADGDLDLVASIHPTNSGVPTVAVCFNDGTGHYTTIEQMATDTNSLALGDLDNDGDLDLVTTYSSYASGVAGVWLNDGLGYFESLPQTAFGGGVALGNDPRRVVLGDLDGDGDLDMVAPNHGNLSFSGPSSVSVRLNNGQGVFAYVQQDAPLGELVHDVVLGDLDADGDLDMVVGNENYATPGAALIRLNNGRGVFSPAGSAAAGGYPIALALADVDGDADLDILAGTNSVALNRAELQVFNNRPRTATATAPARSPSVLLVYPNPARQQFTVQLPTAATAGVVQISIFNTLGQIVGTCSGQLGPHHQVQVSVPGLAAGPYEVRVSSSGQHWRQRLVLE